MRPIGRVSPNSDSLARRPLVEDLPARQLVIADRCGSSKQAFLQRFAGTARDIFGDVGPGSFAVALADRTVTLLP